MKSRVAVPVACLVLGAGLGISGAVYFRSPSPVPTSAAVSGNPAPAAPVTAKPDDEVVVEIRVRVPAGKSAPGAFAKGSSGLPQGALVNTQNQLDLAIEGDGFFQIAMPDGTFAYTRRGNFGQSVTGKIVTAQGHFVSPQITIPMNGVSVAVATDGVVAVQVAGSLNVSTVVGQFVLARFANPGWLRADSNGLYYETERSGPPTLATPGQAALGFVRQGFRERTAEQLPMALIDLVRDLAQEKDNADVNGVRVRVLGKE